MMVLIQMTAVRAFRVKLNAPIRHNYYQIKYYVRGKSTNSNSDGAATFGTSKPGNKTVAVWERMAVAVKYSEKQTSTKYVDTIRATHDPTQDLKSVEEELKGTIGKALGRQGHKILHAKQQMEKELQRYNDLIASHSSTAKPKFNPDVINSARNYNEYRKLALQARWELTVQRQAAGFIVNNQNYVTEHYPIAAVLPTTHEGNEVRGDSKNDTNTTPSSTETDHNQKFSGQLNWWERIGRWR